MKYLIIIIFCLYSKSTKAQVIDDTLTHTDSVNIQIEDTIYANRSNYIGCSMNKLYADLPKFIGFSEPDNIGRRRSSGTAYYKYFTLYLPGAENDGIYGFRVTISSKVYTSVKDYIDKDDLERDLYAKELLKDAIITSIEKSY